MYIHGIEEEITHSIIYIEIYERRCVFLGGRVREAAGDAKEERVCCKSDKYYKAVEHVLRRTEADSATET